jgi:HlyD family secretion protein
MNKRTKIIITVAVLAAAAVAVYFLVFAKGKETITLETAKVEQGTISTVVTATGTIEATKQVEVGTQVSGVVEKIYVDYNSHVKAGQLIAELDKENLQELLAQAKSAYTVAVNEKKYLQTVYNRQNELYQAKVISQSDYQEAEYNLKTATGTAQQKLSDLKRAETNLGYANIYSPIDGVVLSKDVDEGQTVAASYSTPTLFTIAQDLKQMQVEADVDEADIGNVKEGQRVTFTVDAFPDDEFSGSVTQVRLNSTVTSNVVTYTVIIKADNAEEKLKPGLTATVSIYTMELKDVLTLQAKALSFEPDMQLVQEYNAGIAGSAPPQGGEPGSMPPPMKKEESKAERMVWIKNKDGHISPKPVKVGSNDGINYQLLDGLIVGDEVVTSLAKAQVQKGTAPGGETSSPFMPKPPGKRK